MGQHTWFLKSKELYLKQNELYEKLDKFENDEIYLDDLELLQINTEINEIDEQNDAEYHDLFRTSKRNEDGTYIDDVISSKKECFSLSILHPITQLKLTFSIALYIFSSTNEHVFNTVSSDFLYSPL